MLGNEQPNAGSSPTVGSNNKIKQRHHRKPRARLSCEQCRNKKLSCDRRVPCQRCVRSGLSESCSFASAARPTLTSSHDAGLSLSTQLNPYLDDQIKELRSEISELKTKLAVPGTANCRADETQGAVVQDTGRLSRETGLVPGTVDVGETLTSDNHPGLSVSQDSRLWHSHSAAAQHDDLKDLSSRPAQGFYRQHSLFRFFIEIPQLFPFIKEAATGHFRPRSISLRKAKWTTADTHPSFAYLQALLPPDEDAEHLLLAYLQDCVHVHQVIHSPSFDPSTNDHFVAGLRDSGDTTNIALVLSMIAISVTLGPRNSCHTGIHSPYKRMVPIWVDACEKWLRLQAPKRRSLEYHQLSCLVYQAKRMNGIHKKQFWSQTGALVQEAVMDGLHRKPPSTDSPHLIEMKGRIWSTIRELDLQNSFDYRLPTLLSSLEPEIAVTASVDGRERAEHSDTGCINRAKKHHHPGTSYQHLSARSWNLRLDVARALYGSGTGRTLSNEELWRYTDQISQEVDVLPPSASDASEGHKVTHEFLLAKALLTCQLKDCILALHRHRLQRGHADYSSLSETLCYHTARDILFINKETVEAGLRSLSLLREDILTASLTVTRIVLQQPPSRPVSSLPAAITNSHDHTGYSSAVVVLEQCLPIIEERYLRCFNGEPWCPLTMLGAIMLLKIHRGTESRESAKAATAQRFLDLYYKHLLERETAIPGECDLVTPSDTLVDLDLFDFDFDWDTVGADELFAAVD